MSASLRILVIDDDEVSREVLRLLLEAEGHAVDTAESGEAALAHLASASHALPAVVLADLQMPGMRGSQLAFRLRDACGAGTLLLAISASQPEHNLPSGFDGFLLKPFSMEQFAALVAGSSTAREDSAAAAPLNEEVYRKLAASMSAAQLERLYTMCLDDAAKRIGQMRKAAECSDDDAFRRAAHAIKGGCGLVGAAELQTLANMMEIKGIEANHVATLNEFLLASERLRRILVARMCR